MEENHLVAFAERVLTLLSQGSFVATYKYAVLLALMDLCLERTERNGSAPESVTTRQLAEKVLELYWPQSAEFGGRTLRQNAGAQARIVTDICAFRDGLDDPSMSMHRARLQAPDRFERLIRKVEWTLILMPLPRLQVVGGDVDRVLYEIGWDAAIGAQRRVVTRYQAGAPGVFDNNIRLLPGVGDRLVALNGLLRPLLHRAWSAMVAQLNGLHESRLESFLFGANRTALTAVRRPLHEIQRGSCLYCGKRLGDGAQVDHFIPWARFPDNGLENLVLSHERCNNWKRDFLAADGHLERWRERNVRESGALGQAAAERRWETHPADTLGAARGIYLRLPSRAKLWLRANEFCSVNRERVATILS